MTTNQFPTEDLYRAQDMGDGWAVAGWDGTGYMVLCYKRSEDEARSVAQRMIHCEIVAANLARSERHAD